MANGKTNVAPQQQTKIKIRPRQHLGILFPFLLQAYATSYPALLAAFRFLSKESQLALLTMQLPLSVPSRKRHRGNCV